MKCPICFKDTDKLLSGAVDGKYLSARCQQCLQGKIQPAAPTDYYAEYNRERGREDFAKDIVQPFDGFKPNRDFIKAYPEKAKRYFSKRELNENS